MSEQINELTEALQRRAEILHDGSRSEQLREIARSLLMPEREQPWGSVTGAAEEVPVEISKEMKLEHIKAKWLAGIK